jgi:hypothetical protein
MKRDEAKGITSPDLEGAHRSGVKASLTTALAGANNDLTIRAKDVGVGGNGIRITYVVAGANTPLSVTVAGKDITVNVATSGASAPLTRADILRDVLNANPATSQLVTAELAAGNDGTGTVAALAFTNLAGGVDGPEFDFAGPGTPDRSRASIKRQRPNEPPSTDSKSTRVTKAPPGPLQRR